MILEGKTIAVSGVGPGLGREIARIGLRDGANVVIGARNEEKLEKIAAELDPSGKRVAVCAFDATDPERCETFAQAGVDRFGGLHAVAHVAALDALFGTLESTSNDDWERSMKVNVIGTMNLARSCAARIKRSGGGSIVLIGSQSQFLPPDNPQIAYASAKGAILASMYHMAAELGPSKIRVNMVVPTYMWGPPVQAYVKWQASQRDVDEQVVIDEITASMPLGEIPTDDDVAECVAFFCSDRSRMITGETVQVNAGQLMR